MNQIGLKGIAFVEFASGQPQQLEDLFLAFGFSKVSENQSLQVDHFKQNEIDFFLNRRKSGHADKFAGEHGPSICAMGWRFENPEKAFQLAVSRGARPVEGDFRFNNGKPVPAVDGIGGMLLYFMGDGSERSDYENLGFVSHHAPVYVREKGFRLLDHLTNNVEKGTMAIWAKYYKEIFEFTEVRYFDIRGAKTGLTSYALRSPDGSFCIPINEGTESKSQINEYLEQYRGPGVQHLAFLTDDILASLDALKGSPIETLDIDDDYYSDIFSKFPQVKEDRKKIRDYNVLVDGDEQGYLLQIFTKNLIGPIFIEIIQRRNHLSFGEGNFGALFRSIERDQMKRGYLQK